MNPATDLAALEMRGIAKRYPGVQALAGVDLTVRAGEVHALAGENGAGKSTLIKVLSGATRPDQGSMRLGGADYQPRTPHGAILRGIRVVHQELLMLDQLSVAENLLFDDLPRRFGWLDRTALRQKASELLAMVGLDELDPNRRVDGLGMAQRQLLEIAKALSGECRLLVLDEPTATLTARETERLFGIVRSLRAGGVGIIFVSHHLQELFEIADRVTVLRNGQRVDTLPMAQTSADGLVRLMVGRAVSGTDSTGHDGGSKTAGTPALEVRGLRYRGQPAGSAIDLTVQRGEILGLAGLVGSGRTETVRAIFGADRREAGTILRDGSEMRIATPRDALACGICLATEDRKDQGLILDMPVRANVTLADLSGHASKGWLQRGTEAASARAMVGSLDIRLASIEQHPRELSGGNQQKVVLAKWLLRRPAVLILDEPTRGVDVGAKAEIHALLRRAAADGMAILVVSSDLPELLAICDRIAVLSRGRVAGELPRRDFDEQTILQLAYREYLRNDLTDRLDRQAA